MERANLSRLNGWTFPVTATAARPLGTGRALNQIPLSGPGPRPNAPIIIRFMRYRTRRSDRTGYRGLVPYAYTDFQR